MDPAIRKMSRELEKLISQVTPLELEASEAFKELIDNMEKIRESFEKVGNVCARIHKKYKRIAEKFDFEHFTKISEFYLSLNNAYMKWGEVQKSETDNFFENQRMMFDFSLSEIEGLDEVNKININLCSL